MDKKNPPARHGGGPGERSVQERLVDNDPDMVPPVAMMAAADDVGMVLVVGVPVAVPVMLVVAGLAVTAAMIVGAELGGGAAKRERDDGEKGDAEEESFHWP